MTILNEQREQTLRAVASWERLRERLKTRSETRLRLHRLGLRLPATQRTGSAERPDAEPQLSAYSYGQFEAEYYVGRRWLFTGNVALHVPMVDCSDKSPYHEGDVYDRYRVELSGHLSAKWRPTERIGLAVNLRGELYDRHAVPLIPAFFFDWVVSERGNVVLKASVARNYRYPTLNDRYYQPGGNPDLRPEHGFTYDGGISFALGGEAEGYTLRGEATLFDSHIDDWISLGAGAARLLDAPQRPQSPQLRRRDEGRRLGAPLARLAARPRRPLRMDPLDQLRQTGQRRRRLLRQTAGLRPPNTPRPPRRR